MPSSSSVPWGGPVETPTPSLVSRGGPSVVFSSASVPGDGADDVASSEASPSMNQFDFTMNDNDRCIQQSPYRDNVTTVESSLNYPVSLTLAEKSHVVRFLVVYHRVPVFNLRDMCSRHYNIETRLPNKKQKNAATLRSEFVTHECTDICLVLKSEAALAGIKTTTPVPDVALNESMVHVS
jgi:hypothetical protein